MERMAAGRGVEGVEGCKVEGLLKVRLINKMIHANADPETWVGNVVQLRNSRRNDLTLAQLRLVSVTTFFAPSQAR